MKILKNKKVILWKDFDSGFLTQALGAPLLNLSLAPPTAFVAMERYIGNMLISIIPCHMKILKNEKDILWKEF